MYTPRASSLTKNSHDTEEKSSTTGSNTTSTLSSPYPDPLMIPPLTPEEGIANSATPHHNPLYTPDHATRYAPDHTPHPRKANGLPFSPSSKKPKIKKKFKVKTKIYKKLLGMNIIGTGTTPKKINTTSRSPASKGARTRKDTLFYRHIDPATNTPIETEYYLNHKIYYEKVKTNNIPPILTDEFPIDFITDLPRSIPSGLDIPDEVPKFFPELLPFAAERFTVPTHYNTPNDTQYLPFTDIIVRAKDLELPNYAIYWYAPKAYLFTPLIRDPVTKEITCGDPSILIKEVTVNFPSESEKEASSWTKKSLWLTMNLFCEEHNRDAYLRISNELYLSHPHEKTPEESVPEVEITAEPSCSLCFSRNVVSIAPAPTPLTPKHREAVALRSILTKAITSSGPSAAPESAVAITPDAP